MTEKQTVQCVAKTSPFRTQHERRKFPAGTTVGDMVHALIDQKWPSSCINVAIDGNSVLQSMWHQVRPKPGTLTTVCVTPAGAGGEKIGLGILTSMLGALLFVFGGGVFIGIGAAIMAAGYYVAVAGAIYSVASVLGLLPEEPPEFDEPSPTYSVQGSRNQARHWKSIPRIYGEHRTAPPYGAIPYTEVVGDDQYLRLLFVIGYGPLALEDHRIGQTSIDDFDDFDIEILHGFPNDADLTLFSNTVLTTNLSIPISTDYQSRTTEVNADELIVELLFAEGLVFINEIGNRYDMGVTLGIEYKPVDDSWPGTIISEHLSGQYIQPFVHPVRWSVTQGQYDVRVWRTVGQDPNAKTEYSSVNWQALKTVRLSHPIDESKLFPVNTDLHAGGLAMVAIRIRASEQLSGVIDNYNCKARAIVMDYDSYSLDFGAAASPLTTEETAAAPAASVRTFECVAYARATDDSGLFEFGDPSGALDDCSLYLKTASSETWRVSTGNGAGYDYVLAGSVGAWHHYALVYDGTDIELFYDGVSQGSHTVALNTPATDLLIGEWAGNMFDGKIREFRIWAAAGLAADLLANKDAILTTAVDGLTSYFRMSEGWGTKVYNYGTVGSKVGDHLDIPTDGPGWARGTPDDYRWEPRPTRNPASAFRDILQGPANKRPLADSRLDLTTLQEWHNDCKDRGEDLSCTFEMVAGASELYVDLDGVGDYVVQADDYLEFDLYWPDGEGVNDNHQISFGLEESGGKSTWGTTSDQNAQSSAAATDISYLCLDQWYHRKIKVTPPGLGFQIYVGETVSKFLVACDYNGGGTVRAFLRDISITDGKGTIRKEIWMSGGGTPTSAEDSSSDAAQYWTFEAKQIPDAGQAWKFDFIFDNKSSVQSAMQLCANSARASATVRDGLYSVVQDKLKLSPVQHINPRNSWGFRGRRMFPDTLHGLRVKFYDEDQENQPSEIIVYDNNFDVDTATKFESVDLKGFATSAQAWSQGRYLLANMRLRPEIFEVSMDFENLVATRGDLVKLNHDVLSVGLGFARVKSVTTGGGGGTIDTITIDDLFTMEGGKIYAVVVRLDDSSSAIHPIDLDVGDQSTVVLTTSTSDNIQAGDLIHFGEVGSEDIECIVSAIEPDVDLVARLALVPAANAIHTIGDGPIPDYDPFISSPRNILRHVRAPVIIGVVTDETVMTRSGTTVIPYIVVHYTFPSSADEMAGSVVGEIRHSGTADGWQSQGPQMTGRTMVYRFGNVEVGETYDVRIRALSAREPTIYSAWSERTGVLVEGWTQTPPDLSQFTVTELPSGRKAYKWEYVDMPADVFDANIKGAVGSGLTWAQLDDFVTVPVRQRYYESDAPFPGRTYTLGIKAVDVAGNESDNAILIEISPTIMPPGFNAVEDARYLGWPGTKTLCVENDQLDYAGVGELQATDQKTWDDLNTDGVDWDNWTTWARDVNTMVYQHTSIDLGAQILVTPNAAWFGVGTPTIEERHSINDSSWSGWAAVGTPHTDRYFQVRITLAPAANLPVLSEFIIYM